MKLKNAQITSYKSIDDSGNVKFDDVTCLVGKNESGKTAFLQALQKLNPVNIKDGSFNILEYPRKGYTKYKIIHEEHPALAVTANFELSDNEINEIESTHGTGLFTSKIVCVSKNYKNERYWTISIDENIVVKNFLTSAALPPDVSAAANKAHSCQELLSVLDNNKINNPEVVTVLNDIRKRWEPNIKSRIASDYLNKFIPQFVYFDEYSVMPGAISIQHLKQRRNNNQLESSEQTLLALLAIVGSKPEDFEKQDVYESLKAELEAASIGITDEVFAFWSQNKQLEVEFDIAQGNPSDPSPLNVGTILHIRIKNNRHRVSVPFDQRSRGFVWFFSFLAYFSQFENSNSDLILLLDEPGLSLHAKAQADLLRFINERLAPKHQVIYTTHSPFMVDPNQFQKVRTVQDTDDRGTIVSSDVLKNDRDTIFPLQAALGYDLAQTLFVGPDCLLVEGPSDLIYLQILSDVCANKSLDSLDHRWIIVPVGGADKVSTFISLLGANKLNIAVLMDTNSKDTQRIKKLQENGFLEASNLIDIGTIIGVKDADIEDLFTQKFYLKLVNGSYSSELPGDLKETDLVDPHPRIIKRVETYFKTNGINGGSFNHYSPAAYLSQKQNDILKSLDNKTLELAATLFKRINALIPK